MSENNGNGNGNVDGILIIQTTQEKSNILKLGRIWLSFARLNEKRVRSTPYIVCCDEHGRAFFVAGIDEVKHDGVPYVTFHKFAEINRDGFWQRHATGAKGRYRYLESLRSSQFGKLEWQDYGSESEPSFAESDLPHAPKSAQPLKTRQEKVTREDVAIFTRIADLRDEYATLQAKKREIVHEMIDRLDDSSLDSLLLAIEPLLKS